MKANLHTVKVPRQCVAMPNRHCATHCIPETKNGR